MTGTWTPLANQPGFNASTLLLLTDGTVLAQNTSSSDWYKLAPDPFGNYVKGTWTAKLASGPNAPLYYASAVLRDGRVFIAGGEYNNGAEVELLAAEIYDPAANTWTVLATPTGWTQIGDAPSCVLPDGRVLLGSNADTRTAAYDPSTNTWTTMHDKGDSSSEETWTLLPDNSVLVIQCTNHPNTEKYLIDADTWVSAGATPADLVEGASIEVGPSLLLPDGRVFAVGATGHTALYTPPPIAGKAGSWAAGPDFPAVNNQTVGAKDAPACLLPNGRVLCAVGPVDGISQDYLAPTHFFEFDPTSSTLTTVTDPPNSGGAPYQGRMLLLPSGQVLFANESNNVQVYTPDGAPEAEWQPSIASCPTSLQPSRTYTLLGRQLNGLSQAVSYGDDAQMATNYPLVRIHNLTTNHIFYCRTHDHSTMAVNTGTVVHSTLFDVPAGIEMGNSVLQVVANGIGSDVFSVVLFPPTVSSCVSINAVLGNAITPVTMTASGGSGSGYTFAATGLPSGLSMAANGTISGTPTVAGPFKYVVTITDSAGNANTFGCSVTVAPGTDVIVPQLVDLNLKEAVAAVHAVGLRLRAIGVGDVVAQSPPGGTPVPKGSTVTVALSNN